MIRVVLCWNGSRDDFSLRYGILALSCCNKSAGRWFDVRYIDFEVHEPQRFKRLTTPTIANVTKRKKRVFRIFFLRHSPWHNCHIEKLLYFKNKYLATCVDASFICIRIWYCSTPALLKYKFTIPRYRKTNRPHFCQVIAKHNFALECGEHVVYLNRNNSSIKRWTNEPRDLDLARKACDTLNRRWWTCNKKLFLTSK